MVISSCFHLLRHLPMTSNLPYYLSFSPNEKSDTTWCVESDAERSKWIGKLKRLRQNVRKTAQYWGGKFKFENECSFRKQRKFVASSVPSSWFATSPNFSKQRPVGLPYGTTESHEKWKLISIYIYIYVCVCVCVYCTYWY